MAGLVGIDPPAALLAAARCGDERAQAELYAAVAPGAFALIRRLVGSRTLAEDLFQETMLAMFERLGQFRAEAPFGAWVRQIALSKSLMYLRSPWHRLRIQIEPPDRPDGAADSRAGDRLDIERALARLSPVARAVIWLYEVEGYTHEEIARCFGQSVSFSKSQLARAHRKLRARLTPPETKGAPCVQIPRHP